jgi:hypothetical protein
MTNVEPIKRLTTSLVDQISALTHEEGEALDQDFLEELETVFRSPECLNASFLIDNHMTCDAENAGIDCEAWTSTIATIGKNQVR